MPSAVMLDELESKGLVTDWSAQPSPDKHIVPKFPGGMGNEIVPQIIIHKREIQDHMQQPALHSCAGIMLIQEKNVGTVSKGAKWQGKTGHVSKEQPRNEGRLIHTLDSPFRYFIPMLTCTECQACPSSPYYSLLTLPHYAL